MAKAKTVKDGADAIEAALKNSTEAVKEGFDKAVQGYDQLISFSKDNVEAAIKSATLAGKGFEAINTEVFAFSRQTVEEGVEVTKAVFAAKSVQQALEIQAGYAKAAFETYIAECITVRELALSTAKEAAEPLQARATAIADLVQARAA
jgi:phasin family protein